jgi:hypothetical protein
MRGRWMTVALVVGTMFSASAGDAFGDASQASARQRTDTAGAPGSSTEKTVDSVGFQSWIDTISVIEQMAQHENTLFNQEARPEVIARGRDFLSRSRLQNPAGVEVLANAYKTFVLKEPPADLLELVCRIDMRCERTTDQNGAQSSEQCSSSSSERNYTIDVNHTDLVGKNAIVHGYSPVPLVSPGHELLTSALVSDTQFTILTGKVDPYEFVSRVDGSFRSSERLYSPDYSTVKVVTWRGRCVRREDRTF